ncbi:DUF4372 domain-containing protein [Arenibacter palladensis]|uniref:DUF4372 domain-containing protein n=1 Tax=Arenibacter palladensis TaxID=237373 RepID=UPI00349F914E
MNQGKNFFAKLTELLPQRFFDRIVSNHDGDKYVRRFTCWNQLVCMVFGQVSARKSLRDFFWTSPLRTGKRYFVLQIICMVNLETV